MKRQEDPKIVRVYRRESLERERKVRERHHNFARLDRIRTALYNLA